MVHFHLLEKVVDQKTVGNLELGTDLEVDNPKAHTESGVDKHPEKYTKSGVELGVCNILKVENLEVALQVVTDYLEVKSPTHLTKLSLC